MTMDFSAERLSYEKGALLESELPKSPKQLFTEWVSTAVEEQIVEPYAMSLATCGNDNLPSVRTLLMREVTDHAGDGFSIIFYSNYDSAKGADIEENPNAQALFFWHALERQVRLTGKIHKLSVEKSTNYFHKRPLDSQIAAWVSIPQSGVVASREIMEDKFSKLKAQYADCTEIPMPEYWGGYELVVEKVEFWQGRANRMHDRIVYRRVSAEQENTEWQIERLLP